MLGKVAVKAEEVARNNQNKEELEQWEAIQKKMKDSFKAAQKKEEERHRNEMMAIQNEFVDQNGLVALKRDGEFKEIIELSRSSISLLNTFRIRLNDGGVYERQEDLYEHEGKLYAAYKKQ